MIGDEIAQWLEGRVAGFNFEAGAGGNVFVDRKLPDTPGTPDIIFGIFHYPGPAPDPKHGYDNPQIQVRTRGPQSGDPRPARDNAQAVLDALHSLEAQTIGGIYVVNCTANQSGPAPIGPDAKGRMEFTVNFQLEIRNLAGTRE